MTRGVARMLAVAAVLLVAIPARAAASPTFTTTGSITYTWQGDPTRGCAAMGLCGVQGALILGSQSGSSSTSGGRPTRTIDVPFQVSSGTVRVADGPGAGDCVDVPSPPPGGDLLITPGPGGLVARVRGQVSSGRCAGPRAQDLAGLTLPVKRSGGRYPSYDLRGTRSFTAGPFTGRVVSTLVVKTAPNPGGSNLVTGGSFPGGPPPSRKVLLEHVTLRYRLASLPGSLDVAFSGSSDPFCAALDSCGASGTLALSYPGLVRTFEVQASRQVPRRVDAHQALADFRRGRLHYAGGFPGGFGAPSTAQVAETFARSGGLRCQDTSESRAPAGLFVTVGSSRSGRRVSLVWSDPFESGLLRTYCPGPTDADVFGTGPQAATGSIGPAQLLSRRSAISLAAPGSFAGPGYVGTRSGALEFSLTLERVRAGTTEARRP